MVEVRWRKMTVRWLKGQRDEGQSQFRDVQDFFCGQWFHDRALVRAYNDVTEAEEKFTAGVTAEQLLRLLKIEAEEISEYERSGHSVSEHSFPPKTIELPLAHDPISRTGDHWRKVVFRRRQEAAQAPDLNTTPAYCRAVLNSARK
jgi:hypothetical protein